MNISLIIPCYNEVANMQKGVLDKIGNFTRDDSRFGEVLIVDDGSTDESRAIISEKYLAQFPKFRLIVAPHGGKARAVMRGITEANSEYVMFCDADLATPLEEVEKLIPHAEAGYPIVIGSRSTQREDAPLTRQIMAAGMMFLREYFIGLRGVQDTQCGFKLFKTIAARDIMQKLLVFAHKESSGAASVSAIFDLEFLFVASRMGLRIMEVPVVWRHVETKRVNFIKDTIESLTDMMRMKWHAVRGNY